MSQQVVEGSTVLAPVEIKEGGLSKPEITKGSVLSPLDSFPMTDDFMDGDAGSEESSSRIHPQDSVEDYPAETAPKLADAAKVLGQSEQEKKKKSVLRSIKKGASKRHNALARRSKEISSSLSRSLSGRLSFSRRSVASEDTGSQEDNQDSLHSADSDYEKQVSATKIQQAFRSYSAKKHENEVQVQKEHVATDMSVQKENWINEEAAIKIQAAARGMIARKESLKLKEEAKEQAVQPKKKRGGLRRVLFAVASVAAAVAVGVAKK